MEVRFRRTRLETNLERPTQESNKKRKYNIKTAQTRVVGTKRLFRTEQENSAVAQDGAEIRTGHID